MIVLNFSEKGVINLTKYKSIKSYETFNVVIQKNISNITLNNDENNILQKIRSYAIIILSEKIINMQYYLGKNIIVTSQEEINNIEKDLIYLETYENVLSNNGYFTINLSGGLGNQLFMALAIFNLANENDRKFTIKSFGVNKHSKKTYSDSIFSKFTCLDIKCKRKFFTQQKNEMVLKYDKLDIYTKNNNVLYSGYFQNENYVNAIGDNLNEILNFSYINTLELSNYKLLDSSYFLHMRLGDYTKLSFFGILKKNYYINCLKKIINDNLDSDNEFINVYLFSDDIKQAQSIINTEILNNFDANNFNKISIKVIGELSELETFYLMTLCKKGGIISNSTFSWWSGYINFKNNKSKIYIPNKWFGIEEYLTCEMVGSNKVEYN